MKKILQDESSCLCHGQEDRDFNNPAYYPLYGNPKTARTGSLRKEAPGSVHKAAKWWMDNETNANTFQNRVNAERAKEMLMPYLDYLKRVLTDSGRFDKGTIERFLEDQPFKQVLQNRKSATVRRRSMKEIRLNLERNGYKRSMDVIGDICHWVGTMILHYSLLDCFGYMARMLDKAIHQAESSKEMKEKFKVCCFLDRYRPPPMIRCDGMCDLLLEGGNVIYRCVAFDIDYNLCYKCHRTSADIISFDLPIRRNSTKIMPATLNKSCLVRRTIPTVMDPEKEEIVECFSCFSLYHKMCVMYDTFNWEAGYSASCPKFLDNFNPSFCCRSCIKQLGVMKLEYQLFTARTMHCTPLSKYMQSELQSFLYTETSGCFLLPLPPLIQVRELASRKMFFKATGYMAEDLRRNGRPTEFSYRTRSLMLTQDYVMSDTLTGEKALFNVIIHEYDNGWILISYLDSVRLFQPAQFRRRLYQRVLNVYMKYLQLHRVNQFSTLYVWCCPPKEGEEYVFLGRPADQVALDGTGLRIWYEKIFQQGKNEGLVQDYLIIDPTNNPFPTYLDIPYFSDDFWPEKLEQIQKDYHGQVAEYNSFLEEDRNFKGDLRSKRRKKRTPPAPPLSIQQRVDTIFQTDLKNSVFVVWLKQNPSVEADLIPVQHEPDIWSKFMFKRGNYQLSCRQRQIDFSDERRATYATLHMHARMAEESLEIKCWYCEVNITEGFYCYKCEAAVFCKNCRHVHVRFEEEHGEDCMLPFITPFTKLTGVWDETFGKILQVVHDEAAFLTKLSYEMTFPTYRRDSDPQVRELVRIFQHHMELFGREDFHNGTRCKVCGYLWLAISRHRRICRGSLCYVPSCSRRLLYDDDGTILDRSTRWHQHFLEMGTQVTAEDIEEVQPQQQQQPPHQSLECNGEGEEEEQDEIDNGFGGGLDQQCENEVDQEVPNPAQQNGLPVACNFIIDTENPQPLPLAVLISEVKTGEDDVDPLAPDSPDE